MRMAEVSVRIRHVTDKAILVEDGTLNKEGNPICHWIPRSQCNFDDEIGDTYKEGKCYTMEISEWLAKERGLI